MLAKLTMNIPSTKRSRLAVFAAIIVSLSLSFNLPTSALADVTSGLVLKYSFDTAVANGGVIVDESGNGNNGTLNGPAYVVNGGVIGGAYQFDGVDDFIFIPNNASLNVGTADGMTLAAWYNTSTNSPINAQSPLIEWSPGPGGTTGRAGVHMWVNTLGYQWHYPNGGGTGANLVAAGIPFPQNEETYVISTVDKPRNEWHHVAVTYDRLGGVARVYIDGVLAQQRAFSITPLTDYDIYLGKRATDTQRLLGKLDDVRIYNRALSAADVREVYSIAILDLDRVYQDFEPNNGSDQYGWSFGGAITTQTTDYVHGGTHAWRFNTPGLQAGTGIQSQLQRWDMNFNPAQNDRLTFWVHSTPSNNAANTVKLKFFDTANYLNNGFEVWTTKTAQVDQWTQLEVLFSQLPPNFNLTHINKLEFYNYWSGTYYLDDIQVTLKDRAYQAFERCPNAGECGWAWGGTVALATNIVKEGSTSWKLVTTENWAGTGIRSQERRYELSEPDQQSFWHVDLNPGQNDQLTFWFFNLAENGMANNLNVQFFDHGSHFVAPAEYWTPARADYGRWSKISVPFSALPASLDLHNINKIQFQVFWPGTYYIDDIRATKSAPVIDEGVLAQGIVQWPLVNEAFAYEVQESLVGPEGPWQTIYAGTNTGFSYDRLSPSWLRIRWSELLSTNNAESYTSDWQVPVAYNPEAVVIDYAKLRINDIAWTNLAQADQYQVQTSANKSGPWSDYYVGPHTTLINQAIPGQYYRVRAFNGTISAIVDATVWSPAITYNLNGHVQAVGKLLKEKLGIGSKVTLRGFNLGNLLLIEPEFVGIGGAFTPTETDDDDDAGIRSVLTSRFGSTDLLEVYQDAYIQAVDLDNIMRTGAGFVRLPIYYKAIQDGNGNFTEFTKLDEIINLCASRGLYIMLDLHGAPGGQSKELHSGEANLNKLFENSPAGAAYRSQTVTFWQALATRYKDHPMVIGYDLLNEPFGATAHDPSYVAPNGLWTLYNTLYQAIRTIDNKHLIVMEGVPSANDWSTLPDPAVYGWQNIMYQFHFYCFTFDAQGKINGTCDVNAHQTFINGKIGASRQDIYNIPVLIGEFNGFDHRAKWIAHLEGYTAEEWNWSMWSYKSNPNLANWGIFLHTKFDESWPDVNNDSEAALAAKFAKYDTAGHHGVDLTLTTLLKEYIVVIKEPVAWKDLVGVTVNANTITKTASSGWNNGGAASQQVIAADGGVEILGDQINTARMFGLSTTNANAHYNTIHYAIYLANNGLRVYESGTLRGTFGTFIATDRIGVKRTGTTIEYQKNGVTFYTSTLASTGNLILDCAIHTMGGKITNAKIWGGAEPPNAPPVALNQQVSTDLNVPKAIVLAATDADNDPLTYSIVSGPAHGSLSGSGASRTYTPANGYVGSDSFTFKANDTEADSNVATVTIEVRPPLSPVLWKDLVGVTVNANTITKTASSAWGNGGAASQQVITADGGVEILGDQLNKARMFGLSPSNADAQYTSIRYAIYLANNGLRVYESGTLRGTFGTFIATDRIGVKRTGTQIFYQKNGITFYTSTVPSTGNLILDCAIHTTGGKITDAKIWGGAEPANIAPVALNQQVSTPMNTAKAILLAATDADNDPLTYSIVSNPTHGSLSGSGANRTYTPANGYVGGDSFTFKANDGEADSNVATVTIEVSPAAVGVIWVDLVGVSVNANTITKTASAAWGNGGAASQQFIAGDGGVDILGDQINTARMFGLSTTNTNANYTSIPYAIYLATNLLKVYESGTLRGTFGTFIATDRISVKRSGTQILYQKNGVTFYTSTLPSSGNLILDCAIHTTGGKITDAKIWGN